VSAKETHSTTAAVLDATPTSVESGAEGRALARPELLGPIIAVLVVLSFATLSFRHAIVGAAFAGVLVVLAAIDLERGIIPNRIVLPAAGVLYVLQLALFPSHVLAWTLAPLTASLLLALPHLIWLAGWFSLAVLVAIANGIATLFSGKPAPMFVRFLSAFLRFEGVGLLGQILRTVFLSNHLAN